MSSIAVIPGLDSTSYKRHALHSEEAVWVEKNCYIDVWIEVLHALGCDPLALLPMVAAVDFEGDQWTFFKPPHSEIRDLYGVDVQELNMWRPLIEHAKEHLATGKAISTEANSYWLPDTQGTDYRRQHVKTTIVLNDLDVSRERLGYFHNAGYFTLEGEDFRQTFRLDAAPDPTFLPLFAESVGVRHVVRRPLAELRGRARENLITHVQRRPSENPLPRFEARLQQDLPLITERGLAYYHAWAFATIRQVGAAFELLPQHLRWYDDAALLPAAAEFEKVSTGLKALIMKGARAVNGKRALDTSALFQELSGAWATGMSQLAHALGV